MPVETPILSPDPRDRKKYYFHATPLRIVLTPLVKAFTQLFTTLQCRGVEYLPRRGPVVLAANHVTNYDVFFMQFAMPRPIFFMGKAELFKNPLLDVILRQLGGFPVQRGARDDWAVRHAQKVIDLGQVLGIFPEANATMGAGCMPAKPAQPGWQSPIDARSFRWPSTAPSFYLKTACSACLSRSPWVRPSSPGPVSQL